MEVERLNAVADDKSSPRSSSVSRMALAGPDPRTERFFLLPKGQELRSGLSARATLANVVIWHRSRVGET